jgi:hypothetical protein
MALSLRSSGRASKVSQLQMVSEEAAVNRRSALMAAAGIALSLRNPSAASAANTVTATMTVNTFEGKSETSSHVLASTIPSPPHRVPSSWELFNFTRSPPV